MNTSSVDKCMCCGKTFGNGQVVYYDDVEDLTACGMCKSGFLFVHDWEIRITLLED